MLKRYVLPIVALLLVVIVLWLPILLWPETFSVNGWADMPQHFLSGVACGIFGLLVWRLSGRLRAWRKRVPKWAKNPAKRVFFLFGVKEFHLPSVRVKRHEDPSRFMRYRIVFSIAGPLPVAWEWWEYFHPELNDPITPGGTPIGLLDTSVDLTLGYLGLFLAVWIYGHMKRHVREARRLIT